MDNQEKEPNRQEINFFFYKKQNEQRDKDKRLIKKKNQIVGIYTAKFMTTKNNDESTEKNLLTGTLNK